MFDLQPLHHFKFIYLLLLLLLLLLLFSWLLLSTINSGIKKYMYLTSSSPFMIDILGELLSRQVSYKSCFGKRENLPQ